MKKTFGNAQIHSVHFPAIYSQYSLHSFAADHLIELVLGDFADAHFLRLLIRLCAGIQRKCKALRAGIVRSARPVQVVNVSYPFFAHCLGPRRPHSDRAT